MNCTRMLRAVIFLIVVAPAVPLHAAVPASEREALIAVYNATAGSGWTDRSNWNGAPGTECNWFGVTCSDNGANVVRLELWGNNLTGSIPAQIRGLTRLEMLVLPENNLTGAIPSEIGELVELRGLNLYRNQLSGPIPSSIGNLNKLETLELGVNSLSGEIPGSLWTVTTLTDIQLYENQLTGSLPPEVGNLTNLVNFALAVNLMDGQLPATIGSLSKLQTLYLSGNSFDGSIPAELGQLGALTAMNLSGNRFSGEIPSQLGSLSELAELDLAENQLTGPIPSSFGSLRKLLVLRLSGNRLSGSIPGELGSASSLQDLHLDYNELTGLIPAQLGQLSELLRLNLSANLLSGTIPPQLGNLSKLEQLTLSTNALVGPIPADLARLTQLYDLDLATNLLTGPLPDLGTLTKVINLQLGHNPIGGSVPSWVGRLTSLGYFGLEVANIRGELPAEMGNAKNLVDIILYGNAISGRVPAWIGTLPKLELLLMGGNRLSGQIPDSITEARQLMYLDLGGNQLSGPLPANIGNLTELEYLTLGGNLLSGQLPPSFSSLRKLVDVRLEWNDFSGPLPSFAGFNALETLLLQVNHFRGTFPVELTRLPRLAYLGLSANRFGGALPPQIGDMRALAAIDIALNGFTGEVPVEILKLTQMESHGSDFNFNALYTSNAQVDEFLRRISYDSTWSETQTAPPANVKVSDVTDRSAVVSWTAIPYDWGEGGYQVTATPAGGGAPVVTTTPALWDTGAIVRGLSPATSYQFVIRSVSHPTGFQQNLLISRPTSAVSATTAARVVSPPDVAVTAQPAGLVQIGGVPRNEDSFVVTNFGDTETSLTVGHDDSFFTLEPQSFTLAGGASRTVIVRSVPQQAAGSYYGWAWVEGTGTPVDGTGAVVQLLSVTTPTGTVEAVPLASRVELSGNVGSDSIGTVSFRNIGDSPLSGILVSDEDWIVVPNSLVTIHSAETVSVNFNVIRSRRPDAGSEGAITGSLRLLYVDASAAARLEINENGPGISASTVTVVDTAKPKVEPGTIPPLAASEVAHFVAGISSVPAGASRAGADVVITNDAGTRAVDDLTVWFRPLGGDTASSASFGSVRPDNALNLANVTSNVFSSNEVGTLQIRSAAWRNLSVGAKWVAARDDGLHISSLPVFRSDRGVRAGLEILLPGVRQEGVVSSVVYVQEVLGLAATASVRFFTAAGADVGAPVVLTIAGFGGASTVVPAGAASAVITNQTGSLGSISAYAVLTDTSGDRWAVADEARLRGYVPSSPVRIPYAAAERQGGTRVRPVRPGGGASKSIEATTSRTTTSLVLFNAGTTEATGVLRYAESGATPVDTTITVAAHQTLVLNDLVATQFGRSRSRGQLTFSPSGGNFALSAMLNTSAGGKNAGITLPVVGEGSGLRLGQRQLFTAIDQAPPGAVADATPGTTRVALTLSETSGAAATVRLRFTLAEARSLTGTTFARSFALGAGELLQIDDLASTMLQGERARYGNIHNARLEVEVVSGEGSALPLLIATDNGSGDGVVTTN